MPGPFSASRGRDAGRARPRALVTRLVDAVDERIRSGRYAPGERLQTETSFMAEFDVSRTVVREALSRLQAAGLVETKHGIGSFVRAVADGRPFRIDADELETRRDVVAVLELRIGVETEAASIAAVRREGAHLEAMRAALAAFEAAVANDEDTVGLDLRFHVEIARATGNRHFEELLRTFGASLIPRARLRGGPVGPTYLARINAEHESIVDAIEARDREAARAAMRTHLVNGRIRRSRAAEATSEQGSPVPEAG